MISASLAQMEASTFLPPLPRHFLDSDNTTTQPAASNLKTTIIRDGKPMTTPNVQGIIMGVVAAFVVFFTHHWARVMFQALPFCGSFFSMNFFNPPGTTRLHFKKRTDCGAGRRGGPQCAETSEYLVKVRCGKRKRKLPFGIGRSGEELPWRKLLGGLKHAFDGVGEGAVLARVWKKSTQPVPRRGRACGSVYLQVLGGVSGAFETGEEGGRYGTLGSNLAPRSL